MSNGYRTLSQHLNDLKKENFSLKLRIYFLEERMQQKYEASREDVYKRVSECGSPGIACLGPAGSLSRCFPVTSGKPIPLSRSAFFLLCSWRGLRRARRLQTQWRLTWAKMQSPCLTQTLTSKG